jgi:hypothetical protein
MTLQQIVQSLACLQGFSTKWCYGLDKQWCSSSHDGDQVYQVIWPYTIRFGLYPAYKVFLLIDATTLTFVLEKQWCSSSHDGDQVDLTTYGSVCILPTRFFEVMLRPWPLTNNRVPPLIMVIKYTKLYGPTAYGSVSILRTDGQLYTIISPV